MPRRAAFSLENNSLAAHRHVGTPIAPLQGVTPFQYLLPVALVVLASFPLALLAEWGLLSVILKAMTPDPRSGRNLPDGSR